MGQHVCGMWRGSGFIDSIDIIKVAVGWAPPIFCCSILIYWRGRLLSWCWMAERRDVRQCWCGPTNIYHACRWRWANQSSQVRFLPWRFLSGSNKLSGHKDEINQIRVNPAGTRLASCSDDGTAYIWRIDNIKQPSEEIPGLSISDHVAVILKGHTHSVCTVGWCVDRPAGSNELIAT